MSLHDRKQNFIDDYMKINDERVMDALENVLKKSRLKNSNASSKKSILDFAGIWNDEEANEMRRLIEASCETIHPDDWK